MEYFIPERLQLQNEEIQQALSDAGGEGGKIGDAAKAVWPEVLRGQDKNSLEFIPEIDTKVYILSCDR